MPRWMVFCLTTLLLGGWLAAAPTDGTLLESAPYRFPAYADATGMRNYATAEEYAAAVADPRFEFRRIVYASDALPVVAYTYAPKDVVGPVPTVVFNRGGYVQPEIGHQLIVMCHRFAEAGFAVVAPLYRGSAGSPGHDEMGGADLHDLMNIIRVAASLPFVDPQNLFLYGESRGGVMALLAARQAFPARAIATFGAFSDLESVMAAAPQVYGPVTRQVWPTFDGDRARIVEERSAQRWVGDIHTPLLLMHGGRDRDVDPAQTLAFATALQQRGAEYQLMIFAGDNHTLAANRIERDRAAVAWFRAHLAR